MTPNGALFRTDKQGFLPEMMKEMYDDRVKYKRYMLDAKQNYVNTKDAKYIKQISKFNNIEGVCTMKKSGNMSLSKLYTKL